MTISWGIISFILSESGLDGADLVAAGEVVETDLKQFAKGTVDIFEEVDPGVGIVGPKKGFFLDSEVVDFGKENNFTVKTPSFDSHERSDGGVGRTGKSFKTAGKIGNPSVENNLG
jgi:hypothetical protein